VCFFCAGITGASAGAHRHDSDSPRSICGRAKSMSPPVRPDSPRSVCRGNRCPRVGDHSSGVAHRSVASLRSSSSSTYNDADLKHRLSPHGSGAHHCPHRPGHQLAPGYSVILPTSTFLYAIFMLEPCIIDNHFITQPMHYIYNV